MKRRQFVASTGVAGTALFAGCLAGDETAEPNGKTNSSKKNTEESPDRIKQGELKTEVGEDIGTILGSLPESVDAEPLTTLEIFSVIPDPQPASPIPSDGLQTDLKQSNLDYMTIASFGDGDRTVILFVGSFDADAFGQVSGHSEDGFAVGGTDTDGLGRWQDGVDAVVETRNTAAAGLRSSKVERALAPVADQTLVLWVQADTTDSEENHSLVATGFSAVSERQVEMAAVFRLGDDSAVEVEKMREELKQGNESVDAKEIRAIIDQNRALLSAEMDAPQEFLPDNSPETDFAVGTDGTVEHDRGEPVDPSNVRLRIDGESKEPPWADRQKPIESGDRFDFDAPPFKLVQVVWLDPEFDGVTAVLGEGVVVEDNAFESWYDKTAEECTITYVGSRALDASRLTFAVSNLSVGAEQQPLTKLVGERLESGTTFTIEDVAGDERVRIYLKLAGDSLKRTQIHTVR